MKSQINLLQSQFAPKFEWICASHFLLLSLLSIVVGLGSYGGVLYIQHDTQAKVTLLKTQLDAEQATVNELSTAISQRSTSPLLERKLASFTQQTQARGVLLSHIRDLSDLKQRSFSSLFDALSASNSSELWLTRFEVTPDELSLKGQLAQARALPLWIKQLSSTEFFQGQEFNVASVQRSSGVLLFELNSVEKEDSQTLAQAGGSQ